MKIVMLILAIYGFLCLLLSIVYLIRYIRSDRKRYFKFNVVGVNSEKEEFAVKAKDRMSAENIIRETLCTKDSDKWFECPIENN
jgi:hypothetical protein